MPRAVGFQTNQTAETQVHLEVRDLLRKVRCIPISHTSKEEKNERSCSMTRHRTASASGQQRRGTISRLVVVVDVPGDKHLLVYVPNRQAIRLFDRRRPNVPLRQQVQTRTSRRRCGGDAKGKEEQECSTNGLNELGRRHHHHHDLKKTGAGKGV